MSFMFPEEGPDGPSFIEPDYDPYMHRTVTKPLTNFEAFIFMIKVCTGLGMIASAEAVGHAGYVTAIILIPIIGLFLTYLLQIQFRARYYLCRILRVPYLTYAESLDRCIAEDGPDCLVMLKDLCSNVVEFFAVINQFASSTVCIMFLAATVQENFQWPARYTILCMIPFLMLFIFANSLKDLVPVNYLALMLQTAAIPIFMYHIFTDMPPISTRIMFRRPSCWAIFVARYFTATEAVAVVVSIERNMNNPEDFLKPFGILNMAMVVIITAFYVIGVGGYLKYGQLCCHDYSSCKTLISLLPSNTTSILLAKIFYTVGIFLTYGLNIFPTHDILWDKFCIGNSVFKKYMLRITLILGTVSAALIDPSISTAFSLILNTFCLSFLAISFPTFLHICLLWPHALGFCNILYVWNTILIFIGVFFFSVSLYQIVWVAIQLILGKFDI